MTTDEPDERAIHAPTDTEQADADERALAETQRAHWQHTYRTHPHMYGRRPSSAAVHAVAAFRAAGAEDVLELGAGHGRDALWFAHEGFTVLAADFSPTGLEQLRSAARSQGLAERITTVVHDVRASRCPCRTRRWTRSSRTCCCAWHCPPRRSTPW
jgi:predicted O-methyltransferase YrrM